jgi:hypothetical protein
MFYLSKAAFQHRTIFFRLGIANDSLISVMRASRRCWVSQCQFRSFPSGALRCASSTNRSSSGFVDSLIACFPQIDQLAKNAIKVYFLYMIDFEFDENKSLSNFEKHGIDFIEA